MADYSLAQSLWSHLAPHDIAKCLVHLRRWVKPGHVFLATFFEGDSSENELVSHAHKKFQYRRELLEELGSASGWRPEYVGDWGHPRDQRLMRYVATGKV